MNLLDHTISVMNNVPNTVVLRLAAFLHDIGKPFTASIGEDGFSHFYMHGEESAKLSLSILNDLKFDGATKNRVLDLVRLHDMPLTRKTIKRTIAKLGVDFVEDLLVLKRADVKSQNFTEVKLNTLNISEQYFIKALNEPCHLSQLNVNGTDLIQIGIPQGKQIGQILAQLLEMVQDEPELNDKGVLLNIAKLLSW